MNAFGSGVQVSILAQDNTKGYRVRENRRITAMGETEEEIKNKYPPGGIWSVSPSVTQGGTAMLRRELSLV